MKFNAPNASRKSMRNFRMVFITSLTIALVFLATSSALMAPLSGAIFTTESLCDGTNVNIFDSKAAVHLNGGPAHPGSAGLPDGEYYVQVTEPDGTLLGTSVGTTDETPVVISGGEFVTCYQLQAILRKASNAGPYPVAPDGYDTTSNGGGVYKVWVSTESSFTNSASKTDNFKVEEDGGTVQENPILRVRKFYDANANGTLDLGELLLDGWKFRIQDGFDIIRFTPVDIVVAPDTYAVTEFAPIETNWVTTTMNPQAVSLAEGEDKTLNFGNVCLGAGGGLTLGFWSNKNGQALIGADDLAQLVALNLRDAGGNNFDPANYAAFRNWDLSANATNMAYMLSAQMSAMKLNVYNNKVNGNALIYAPGLPTVAPSGFASVNTILNAANTELGLHGFVLSGNSFRTYQENLKNALDRANNNLNFVQAQPCGFSFAETE